MKQIINILNTITNEQKELDQLKNDIFSKYYYTQS